MHPYLKKSEGWESLAGQDISVSRNRFVRYLLVQNTATRPQRGAILTVPQSRESTDWETHFEGSVKDATLAWTQLDRAPSGAV